MNLLLSIRSKHVTSNSVPTNTESKVMTNDKVIAPGIFRINSFNTSKEDKFVPINQAKASVRTNPIIISQPRVIIKKHVNSDSNGLSSTGVDNTAKTRRPQPRSNTKNDRLAIRNDKSEVVCAMCKQCLVTYNRDVCVLNYVNGMNSCVKNLYDNVSKTSNHKKHKPTVMKPKKVGSKERLALPKPRKPRTCLRWLPTRRMFDLKGKIIDSSESESQSDCSKYDNACTSNPQEPTRKRFLNSTFSLAGHPNLFMFLGTIRFGNDHVVSILGYGDLQWGNILITKVYFVKGLGYNLFSVGQFCDSDLEVAFRRNTCFVRNLEGVNLLKINRTTNLYTINLHKMAPASPICLMARATSTKSWTKKIVDTMNVTFDELLAMDFEQSSSKPRHQGMNYGQISSGLDLTYAPSTITTQKPTEPELDLLFKAMYDDYIGGQPSSATRSAPAAQAPQVLQTLTTSTTTADTAPTPINSSSQATNIPNTSQGVDELETQQQHVQQQDNQAL
ncbi:hypothetical protein Tco_0936468 [Tanacetum coccineum]